jgi:hypothetical protein
MAPITVVGGDIIAVEGAGFAGQPGGRPRRPVRECSVDNQECAVYDDEYARRSVKDETSGTG